MDARQVISGMTECVDARQAISGMTKRKSFLAKAGIPGPICHSRNLLAGIQKKQKHGCPTGNFGHDRVCGCPTETLGHDRVCGCPTGNFGHDK